MAVGTVPPNLSHLPSARSGLLLNQLTMTADYLCSSLGFSEYCSLPRIRKYSRAVTGLYLGGFAALAHSGMHSTRESPSGATKYGIEYRARVTRSMPSKRS